MSLFAILWVLPLLPVAFAWWRYFTFAATTRNELLRTRIALVLLSLSSGCWLGVFALMSANEHSQAPPPLLNTLLDLKLTLSPGLLFLINLPVCAIALTAARVERKVFPQTIPLKRAVTLASACLMFVWFLFASNSH